MEKYRDFTIDQEKWGNMDKLVAELHENDQNFVLILDPAIPSEAGPGYSPAETGLEERIIYYFNYYINIKKVTVYIRTSSMYDMICLCE